MFVLICAIYFAN